MMNDRARDALWRKLVLLLSKHREGCSDLVVRKEFGGYYETLTSMKNHLIAEGRLRIVEDIFGHTIWVLLNPSNGGTTSKAEDEKKGWYQKPDGQWIRSDRPSSTSIPLLPTPSSTPVLIGGRSSSLPSLLQQPPPPLFDARDPWEALVNGSTDGLGGSTHITVSQQEMKSLRETIASLQGQVERQSREIMGLNARLAASSNEISCPVCTMLNPVGSLKCTICTSPIPVSPRAVVSPSSERTTADSLWVCSVCTYSSNTYIETVCGLCSGERNGTERIVLAVDVIEEGGETQPPVPPPLKKENSAGRSKLAMEKALADSTCIICFERPQNAIAVPCGHNSCCMEDSNMILTSSGACPICNSKIREFVKFYPV